MLLSRRALLALGSAALAFPAAAFAQGMTSIKMAGVAEDSATPVLYGIQSGLFRPRGLDVELETQHNGPAIMSGVAGNSYQIGKSSTPPLIAAFSRGLPFVMIAPAGLYVSSAPIAALLVKNDAPIAKASDLNGKTIATGALNDVHSLATRAWIDKNGGDSSAVKFVEIPISEIPVSIAQGRVDAGSANEPVLSAALAGGSLRVLGRNFDAIAPRFMYTAWFTTKQYAAANTAAVKNFTVALKQAAQYVNTHHAQTIEMIAKYTSLEPAQVRKMTRVEQGTVLDPKLLQPVIDAMFKYKYLAQAFDARDLIVPGLT
ncbi:MAG TPA: ABC transporter substrate-binding protein [Candidatus Binatia bacterium]|nr:ABC transporter substrate-binding protein [Candidatus Binatia bacterium]